MPALVLFILVFVGVGTFFLFIHLLMGHYIRPSRPDAEKQTIYECGEPAVGSAWIQFDLRYYVVALLFVVFDVEVAFFFPWAVVFGPLTTIAQPMREIGVGTVVPGEGNQQASYAGTDAGAVVATIEYPSMAALAEAEMKLRADKDYVAWVKSLDKIRTIVSDSIYREL